MNTANAPAGVILPCDNMRGRNGPSMASAERGQTEKAITTQEDSPGSRQERTPLVGSVDDEVNDSIASGYVLPQLLWDFVRVVGRTIRGNF